MEEGCRLAVVRIRDRDLGVHGRESPFRVLVVHGGQFGRVDVSSVDVGWHRQRRSCRGFGRSIGVSTRGEADGEVRPLGAFHVAAVLRPEGVGDHGKEVRDVEDIRDVGVREYADHVPAFAWWGLSGCPWRTNRRPW